MLENPPRSFLQPLLIIILSTSPRALQTSNTWQPPSSGGGKGASLSSLWGGWRIGHEAHGKEYSSDLSSA